MGRHRAPSNRNGPSMAHRAINRPLTRSVRADIRALRRHAERATGAQGMRGIARRCRPSPRIQRPERRQNAEPASASAESVAGLPGSARSARGAKHSPHSHRAWVARATRACTCTWSSGSLAGSQQRRENLGATGTLKQRMAHELGSRRTALDVDCGSSAGAEARADTPQRQTARKLLSSEDSLAGCLSVGVPLVAMR